MLGPGNLSHVRSRAERQNDVVVGQFVGGSFRRDDPHDLAVDIDVFDRRLDEARAPEAGADRLRAMAKLQDAGARLEEERAEEEEVVAADERDLDVGPPAELPVEMASGGEASDSAAQNEDPRGHGTITTRGFPLSTTYVASSAPLSLPTFLAEWTVRAGMKRTSPARSVTG